MAILELPTGSTLFTISWFIQDSNQKFWAVEISELHRKTQKWMNFTYVWFGGYGEDLTVFVVFGFSEIL